MVLHTDFSLHSSILVQFEPLVTSNDFDLNREQDKLLTMKILLHASDISNVYNNLLLGL